MNADADAVTTSWTGAFTQDGQVIGTFKLESVSGHIARAEIVGIDLPSYGFRLFPPTASTANESRHAPSADEAHIPTVDARVISRTREEGKIKVAIGLVDVDLGRVTSKWTGAFTKDGKLIEGTRFALDRVEKRIAWATISGTDLPSEKVRLFPPSY